MKKKVLNSTTITCIIVVFAAISARAEETFIDCSVPNDQCKALYASSDFFIPDALNQVAGDNAVEVPAPIARTSTEPLAISQPYTPTAPVLEYKVKDVDNGSIITEKKVATKKNDDGSVVEVSRTKETAISPKYVALPAISDVQRGDKVTFGEDSHDWQAPKGETLRTLLMDWGEKSGWTVVWQLERDYILEAGVVFRGSFVEVASAILRTFARATPAPIGTFYKGNRVLLVTTQEDDNAQ